MLSRTEHKILMAYDLFISSAVKNFARRMGVSDPELEAIRAELIRRGFLFASGNLTPKGKKIINA